MKTQLLALAMLALGLSLTRPAAAQDVMKYDTIMEKRADLRLKWIHAQREAAASELRFHRSQSAEDRSTSDSIDRPNLVTFMGLSAKRADLRLRANKIGIEAAYDEWMGQQGRH